MLNNVEVNSGKYLVRDLQSFPEAVRPREILKTENPNISIIDQDFSLHFVSYFFSYSSLVSIIETVLVYN